MATHIREMELQGQLSAGLRVTWVGLVVNVALVFLKIFGGIVGRSHALIADAIHSASDLFSDITVILGLKWGRKEADANHPYGHGRIETIATLLVGIILLLAAISIAYDSMQQVYEHRGAVPTPLAVVVAAVSIISKEIMYWYTVKVGRRIRSSALIGNAWHHRSDALSSVAVLIGVLATQINPDWYLADAVAALLVSLFLLRVCYQLLRDSAKELTDTAPEGAILLELARRAEKVNGVMQVHDLKARHHGPNLLVEMHVVVDRDLSIYDAHEIAEDVKSRLLENMDSVEEVMVHIEPDTEMEDNDGAAR
jgi:cation diffusion facilitator family transporter